MTIRFYPSRLPGEPLETHEHGVTSIRSWLVANVEGYEDRDVPPLTVEVEGLLIPPGEWAKCVIRPDSDWIGPYISRHFLSLYPLLVRRRRYSRGERYPSALCGCHSL